MHYLAEQRTRPWPVRVWRDLGILFRAFLCGYSSYSIQRLRADHAVLARPSGVLNRAARRVLKARGLPELVYDGGKHLLLRPLTLAHARYFFYRVPELERALFPEVRDDAESA